MAGGRAEAKRHLGPQVSFLDTGVLPGFTAVSTGSRQPWGGHLLSHPTPASSADRTTGGLSPPPRSCQVPGMALPKREMGLSRQRTWRSWEGERGLSAHGPALTPTCLRAWRRAATSSSSSWILLCARSRSALSDVKSSL